MKTGLMVWLSLTSFKACLGGEEMKLQLPPSDLPLCPIHPSQHVHMSIQPQQLPTMVDTHLTTLVAIMLLPHTMQGLAKNLGI